MKIMTVDDSRHIRRLVIRMLEKLGHEIVEAGDGKECLEKLAVEKVDLILLDWNMPVMEGIDALKALRAQKEFDSIKVIMMTTENTMNRIQEALDAGANEYIMKPFDEPMLVDKIAALEEGGLFG